ncbi:MAG: bifunctional hydroxymethylpyrimidine kinase/phosphomethylpyrimidine kinase [Thermoplasmatales archaeon]|nr:bifunctional hydroxymethylpyrimidine kinase/phosphomethylpyrimidine kinase [Thermoplasmatales archaeon]
MKVALSIAGSDPIGGAGIQADVKAMAALGVHCCTAITAVTSQNSKGVQRVLPLGHEDIAGQIASVLADAVPDAVKFGMLHGPAVTETVREALAGCDSPMVLDPVMVATSGGRLDSDDLVAALVRDVFPMCLLVTPNRFEAEILSGIEIRDGDDAARACETIGKGGIAVLLKGGHMDGSVVRDLLYADSEFTFLEHPRLGLAGHGSGCTLSSYITANLAKGLPLKDAVVSARRTMQDAISTGYDVGPGRVVNPMAGRPWE